MHAVINGIKLAYSDEGKGSPLIFVHGFPLCRGAWQKQIDAFRPSHRVIAPDLRGMGDSDSGKGTTTMSQFAEDVHALLQQLGTGPVVLAGHSMGGYVALAFARLFPQMMRGLVLVCTKAVNDTPEAAAARRTNAEKVRADGTKVIIDAMAPKMLAPSNQDPKMAELVRGFMAPAKAEGVIGALLGMAERPDSSAMLGSIEVPTLVITGADDVIIPPAESEKMAQAIRGSQLKVIPNAGHLVAVEQPDAFNLALKEWLKNT